MDWGFQTWKDWLEVLGIPVGLAAAGGLFQLLNRRRQEWSFKRIVLRELEEIGPHPTEPKQNGNWTEHQQKTFVHQKFFNDPSQSQDLILRLPEDLVYFVSQLWASKAVGDANQWLHYLDELSNPKYDKRGEIKKVREQWKSLIRRYDTCDRPLGADTNQ